MINRTVARRYAEALVDLAGQANALDTVEENLASVVGLLEEKADFRRVVEHARITPQEKINFLKKVLGHRLDALTLKFLSLVVTKRRERHLTTIYEEFVNLANERRGQVDVQVESGRKLPLEEVMALRERLRGALGRDVRLQMSVNPDLIAGVRVRVGDMVIDGSVAARLRSLKRQLQEAKA